MLISSALLDGIPGIRYGFGFEKELVPQALQGLWDRRPVKKQVHGTHAAHITVPQQEVGHADAFYTRQPGIPVSVITADCVPLLLARRDGAAVAAVHAGWRGLYDGIIPSVLDQLRAGEDWVAVVGPTICAPCYEISEELAQDFGRRFDSMPRAAVQPAHRHLDLRAVAEHQLRQAGLKHIEHVGGCTCCARDAQGENLFRSYRRGDRNSQQHAGLYITHKETT
ncbi:MAG TPA: polyphenol oxidase family protein [Pseudoduganella sp.]